MSAATLRIGVDARTLLDPQPTGVERVVHHYVESLRRVAPADHEYTFFVDREPEGALPFEPPGEVVVVPPSHPRLQRVADLWIALDMLAEVRSRDLAAFVSPNTKFPLTRRSITTVHGLEWSFCAADYRWPEKIKQWVWFQLCSRYSAGMVTFAQHTKGDILRLRPRTQVPICVVPEGVNPLFRELTGGELDPAALEALGIRAPFVLSACSLEPRKNVDRLIRAFGRLHAERDLQHQLVLVGRSGWKSGRLRSLIEELGLADRVLLAGYVSDETLLQAYNQAELFVYPSKYEGFGLPLVEAMACGTPIVTSDSSSMREVAGPAAVLIDPHSDESLATGIARVLDDADLRAELARAGRSRVSRYSWDVMTSGICSFVSSVTPGSHVSES